MGLGRIREGFLEEEHSTLAGKDWGIGEGFLEERTPEINHKRQLVINQLKKKRVFLVVGLA